MRPPFLWLRGEKAALICYAWGMSKHEAVTTHTFTTEEGIKIVIEMINDRFSGASIQFPGSGNRPLKLIPAEVRELAAVAQDASSFLDEQGIMVKAEPRLG